MAHAVKLDKGMINDLEDVFRVHDYAKEGAIFSRDIRTVIRSVRGLKPSEAEIEEMVEMVDNSGGRVDLKSLVKMITSTVTNPNPDTPEAMAEMFVTYDTDGRGYISVQHMKHVLTSVGQKLTEQEADELLKISNSVERGAVNYRKFVNVICK